MRGTIAMTYAKDCKCENCKWLQGVRREPRLRNQHLEIKKNQLFTTKKINKMETNFIGKKVIVRADRAGVFYGTLQEKNGSEVILKNCRRLWSWSGACSISEIALRGVAKPNGCKFTVSVDEICVLGAIEIIPCTDQAIENIESVKVWEF